MNNTNASDIRTETQGVTALDDGANSASHDDSFLDDSSFNFNARVFSHHFNNAETTPTTSGRTVCQQRQLSNFLSPPAYGVTLQEQEAEKTKLEQENFDLKMQVFHLEEKVASLAENGLQDKSFNSNVGSCEISPSSSQCNANLLRILDEKTKLLEESRQDIEERDFVLHQARVAIEGLQREVVDSKDKNLTLQEKLLTAETNLEYLQRKTKETESRLGSAEEDMQKVELQRDDMRQKLKLACKKGLSSKNKQKEARALADAVTKENIDLQKKLHEMCAQQKEVVEECSKMQSTIKNGKLDLDKLHEQKVQLDTYALRVGILECDLVSTKEKMECLQQNLCGETEKHEITINQLNEEKVRSNAKDNNMLSLKNHVENTRQELYRAREELDSFRQLSEENEYLKNELHDEMERSCQERNEGKASLAEKDKELMKLQNLKDYFCHTVNEAVLDQMKKTETLEDRITDTMARVMKTNNLLEATKKSLNINDIVLTKRNNFNSM